MDTSRVKRVNPYTALQEECRKWAREVTHPFVRSMWVYPKARLEEGWNMLTLSERVAAADQLGYDVRLRNTDDGLRVEYVKRPSSPPWGIR